MDCVGECRSIDKPHDLALTTATNRLAYESTEIDNHPIDPGIAGNGPSRNDPFVSSVPK